jgi:hypothetical protein
MLPQMIYMPQKCWHSAVMPRGKPALAVSTALTSRCLLPAVTPLALLMVRLHRRQHIAPSAPSDISTDEFRLRPGICQTTTAVARQGTAATQPQLYLPPNPQYISYSPYRTIKTIFTDVAGCATPQPARVAYSIHIPHHHRTGSTGRRWCFCIVIFKRALGGLALYTFLAAHFCSLLDSSCILFSHLFLQLFVLWVPRCLTAA